ncbi:N-acetyltransferase [Paroceanicella profunda]|uniref:N-acetyltransferase n=1 Tax=Paroceanicella profunda TaxID=2579971 RepID=A0A5B8G0M0_9RHOB|nr:N-acetyltransferase [Paroceanicella profunda]QDL91963.1 N-acetyltransferase [Paroceanicella profunda]
MLRIFTETPSDTHEVEYLYDLCFAPGRTALSSYRLRDGVEPVGPLCRIARDEYDVLAGAIRFWPIRVGPAGHRALLLGPVAVHPTHQGEGLGALLITEGVERARELGWERILLVGDAPYYNRFGFEHDIAEAVDFPPPTNPARILARELVPGAMEGVGGLVRRWED